MMFPMFMLHIRVLPQLVRTDVWSCRFRIVDAQGIGIQNFWTWIDISTPRRSDSTIITNTTSDSLQAINPLYISGDARLVAFDRVGMGSCDADWTVTDSLQPWAAESVEWEDDTTIGAVNAAF